VESELFARALNSPAVQSLAQRLEEGDALSLAGVSEPAQPFVAALAYFLFPGRPIVVVTAGLKSQETFHQDLITWLQPRSKVPAPQLSTFNPQPLFYPAWEILPHEERLPHADVISERLETLVSLSRKDDLPRVHGLSLPQKSGTRGNSSFSAGTLVVTNVAALMQRTFAPGAIEQRTKKVSVGDKIEPLDLVEWLEEQGYEPEAQVTQKGELALRGGILDLFPLTSPWPVRLEFFGDEIESMRYFDPLTQISREEVHSIIIPPGGELGILKKQETAEESKVQSPKFWMTNVSERCWITCQPTPSF